MSEGGYPGYGQQQPPFGQQPPPYGAPPPGYGPQPPPVFGPPGYQQPGYQQPGYQQPGYQQPGYGPPPGYGGYGYGAPGGRQRFGIVGAVLALLGAVLLVIAFTGAKWYDGSGGSKFSDVKTNVDALDKENLANGFAHAYFGWLAWVLLVLAVLAAIAANLPGPAATPLRILGAVVGVAGIAATFIAIKLSGGDGGTAADGTSIDYNEYLKHASVAFYLALAGFLVLAIGSMIGPRRS